MSALFDKLWLRADTRIDNLTPGQRRAVRNLCERFFEKGRQFPVGSTPKTGTIVPEVSTTDETANRF